MVLLTFAIILVIALIISLISYVIKEFKKPKGERFDVKGQINQKINTLKNLNKQKVKNTNNVFKEISKCKHVEKFLVEAPSLHEIFISKVGESYEE